MNKPIDESVDVLIVGGGLTGASLMLALSSLGIKTKLIETKSYTTHIVDDFDSRSLALSKSSVAILKMLQVWPLLQEHATPIEKIQVSERSRFGRATLSGSSDSPLGYVVEMPYIQRALMALLDKQQVLAPATLIACSSMNGVATIRGINGESTIKAALIVAADGTDSAVRQFCGAAATVKAYDQHAIVANIGLARPHAFNAYERFSSSGPLAFLPLSGLRAAMVWALSKNDARQWMEANEGDFLKGLQEAFGYRLGRLVRVGRRHCFPLRQVQMPRQVQGRVVFIGNAAQTLHPVAGQGFNLGLRDVASLAECIASHGLGSDMLQSYQDARRHDKSSIIQLTQGLIDLFSSTLPGLGQARGLGLLMLDHVPLFKKWLARYTSGFGGVIPDLVCGIPIQKEFL